MKDATAAATRWMKNPRKQFTGVSKVAFAQNYAYQEGALREGVLRDTAQSYPLQVYVKVKAFKE